MAAMKVKTRTVLANREGFAVSVLVKTTLSDYGTLTSSEHQHVLDSVTSAVMQVLADAPHVHVPLSRLKVRS